MFNKPHILSDKTKTSSLILSRVKKNLKSYPIKKANLFIVIGGDGFMLKVLKRFHKFNKPFYGINSGSYGFLMNKFSTKNLLKKNKDLSCFN